MGDLVLGGSLNTPFWPICIGTAVVTVVNPVIISFSWWLGKLMIHIKTSVFEGRKFWIQRVERGHKSPTVISSPQSLNISIYIYYIYIRCKSQTSKLSFPFARNQRRRCTGSTESQRPVLNRNVRDQLFVALDRLSPWECKAQQKDRKPQRFPPGIKLGITVERTTVWQPHQKVCLQDVIDDRDRFMDSWYLFTSYSQVSYFSKDFAVVMV